MVSYFTECEITIIRLCQVIVMTQPTMLLLCIVVVAFVVILFAGSKCHEGFTQKPYINVCNKLCTKESSCECVECNCATATLTKAQYNECVKFGGCPSGQSSFHRAPKSFVSDVQLCLSDDGTQATLMWKGNPREAYNYAIVLGRYNTIYGEGWIKPVSSGSQLFKAMILSASGELHTGDTYKVMIERKSDQTHYAEFNVKLTDCSDTMIPVSNVSVCTSSDDVEIAWTGDPFEVYALSVHRPNGSSYMIYGHPVHPNSTQFEAVNPESQPLSGSYTIAFYPQSQMNPGPSFTTTIESVSC